MGSLEIRNLVKVYGNETDGVLAVDDVNINVQDGEFVVLVGPSGCGKSTTLRCIAGLESLTGGNILLDGKSITNKKPKDRDIAMVFQSYALYPHMNAYQNMAFGLKMSTDMSEESINDRVTDVAEMMGIEALLEQKPEELSGGQQQRVALGRAIVREPDVFLMDEPLSNLDAKLRAQMRTELQDLQRELDITTIYVTHDQTEAMTMGDKIAILDDGELQQFGRPLECYNEPTNQFVAGFIGSPGMNFLSVRNRGGTLNNETFEYKLPDKIADWISGEPSSITLGIRPEDIQLTDTQGRNSVSGVVQVVEPMGDVTVLTVSVGDNSITASITEQVDLKRNDPVKLRFPSDEIHLFNADSGAALVNREQRQTQPQSVQR